MTSSNTRSMGASRARPSTRSESSPLRMRLVPGATATRSIREPLRSVTPALNAHRALRRRGNLVDLLGGGVHRLLWTDLVEQRFVHVLLDDVRLLSVTGHLRAHRQVLEL